MDLSPRSNKRSRTASELPRQTSRISNSPTRGNAKTMKMSDELSKFAQRCCFKLHTAAGDFVILMSERMCRTFVFTSVQTQPGTSLNGPQRCARSTLETLVEQRQDKTMRSLPFFSIIEKNISPQGVMSK